MTYMYTVPPQIPVPPDLREAERWHHTRLRRRMLDGEWKQDLIDKIQEHVGSTRREAWGAIDQSSNIFRVICREMSVLYDREPRVFHPDDSAIPLTGRKGIIQRAGLWQQQQRFQSWVVGMRECLYRIDVDIDGVLNYRPVFPDMVHCVADPDRPDEPLKVCEMRQREHEDGSMRWTFDELDISDPSYPIYKVYDAKGYYEGAAVDLSDMYLGGDMCGDAYPYRKKDGTPVLPYQMYHADRLGDRLWDSYEMMEVVDGSLNLAVAYSMWFHVLKDASWPQRYIANGRVSGLDISGGDRYRAEIVTDPATVLMLEATEDGNQISVGQWNAGGDLSSMIMALQEYAARLAQDAGLNPTDIQRVSGNARSGYAIALTNQGKREQQMKLKPQFSYADEQLMSRTAIIMNSMTGSNYPEEGYEVVYRQIPMSAQERKAHREDVFERLDRGFISPAEAKAELEPGLTVQQAAKDIVRVAALRRGLENI